MRVVNSGLGMTAASVVALLLATAAGAQDATLDLRDAMVAAMTSNPQINQAVQNKEATEFERKQAQGQFLPRISVEGSAGVRQLTNDTRRSLGIADQTLWPIEADLNVSQVLYDSGARAAELKRQAARTDGAAHRVEERSQFIALNVARQYFDYMLQQRIVAAADDNVAFHQKLAADLQQGVEKGSISIADEQQAQERLKAALARRVEAQEDLESAAISFRTLTGIGIDQVRMPAPIVASLPPTLDDAIEGARLHNPLVREAQSDVSAADQMINGARAALGPTVSLEGAVRYGKDIDGFAGRTEDYLGRVVLRWSVFDGGINRANVQEQIRRASESRYHLHQVQREAEEEARTAWSRLQNQTKLLAEVEDQSHVADDLLLSYRQQFNVGRRSLLDVLDTQNTRFNIQVQRETARFAVLYAQYRLLAATDKLLDAMGITPQGAAKATEMDRFKYGPLLPAELHARHYTDRGGY